MKSPDQLAATLTRQWHNASSRASLLLGADVWPLRLSIGRPSPDLFARHTGQVREHIERWRAVTVGSVNWQSVSFRSAAEPVSLPLYWQLSSLDDWSKAAGDATVQLELLQLRSLLNPIDLRFRPLLVRQRGLWLGKDPEEVIQAAALALELEPGIANGAPLRSVALAGIDSKFMERNRSLVTALLNQRFDNQASALGLSRFLDAADEGEHWLLVVPLSPHLLPFAQQRVRARELINAPLPAARILLIENERCLHRLPPLPDTIAVLGSGLDLAWLRAGWLSQRRLGYWGDMDTWGLHMLALARQLQPHLEPLLMDKALFERHAGTLAVREPVTAGPQPAALTEQEREFYRYLQEQDKGRIEQEFLPEESVIKALYGWS